jgi:uncharacterized iron-regulated protein
MPVKRVSAGRRKGTCAGDSSFVRRHGDAVIYFIMRKSLPWIALFFFIPSLLSCVQKTLPHWVSMIQEITPPVGSEEIFKLPEGEKRSFPQFLEELDGPRVIFVRESHDQTEHHRIQVSLLQELVIQGKWVVGLRGN